MTKKEAIEILRGIHIPSKCWHSENEALDRAIKALEQTEVKGDLISREALKEFSYINKGNFNTVESIREWVDNAPTVPLRLMTVEECAGHTIDYAMGWKACIEWIKKGCAE